MQENAASVPSKEVDGFGIDNFLLTALENPRDRLTILKLDQELEAFVKDEGRTRLEFPPTSSYQRLIVHRVAQHFKLEHVVLDAENGKRGVVLFKTVDSKIPVLRFVDLIEQPEGPPAKAVKIMRRGQPDLKKSHSASGVRLKTNGGGSSAKDRTLEEREEEYAKARARIFGKEEPEKQAEASPSSPGVTVRQEEAKGRQGFNNRANQPNDAFEYNRNAEPSSWSRMWGGQHPQPLESFYNYDYYDPNVQHVFNYRNTYPSSVNWTEANMYSNYLASPNPPPPQDFPPIQPMPQHFPPQPQKQPLHAPPKVHTRAPQCQQDKKPPDPRVPQVRKAPSPPATPPFYGQPARTPPPIIYTYPNEDMWSFYSNGLAYGNPVAYPVMGAEAQLAPYYYDYDRRPPRSAELFDPNAPNDNKPKMKRPFASGMMSMQNFPRSPSHDSFFQNSQGQNPKARVQEQTQAEPSRAFNGAKQQPPNDASAATQLQHILEISGLSQESHVIGEIEETGAVIKWLNGNTALAIYKTANAAKEACNKFQGSPFSVRPWRVPLLAVPGATPPSAQFANLTIQEFQGDE